MKSFDFISTEIKINYDGIKSHASVFGAIISIGIFCLTIAFGIYEMRELWEKKKPITNILNAYTPDAGKYHLGIGGLNHYFTVRGRDGNIKDLDERYAVVESILVNGEGQIVGSYRYKKCIWDLDGVDFHSFEKNVNKEEFEKAVCIREFYNMTTNELIILEQKNIDTFPFPNLAYGLESPIPITDKHLYFITMRECNPEKEKCFSDKQIKEYYVDQVFNFAFIDKTFNVSNHKEPIKSSFNMVNGLLYENYVSINHMNFNPSTVISDDGIVFENLNTKRNIYLFQNEKVTEVRNKSPMLTQVNIYLKNQETIYTRGYIKIQDVFANIGGFFNFIYYSAILANFFPEKYRLVIDTKEILEVNNYISNDKRRDNDKNLKQNEQENKINILIKNRLKTFEQKSNNNLIQNINLENDINRNNIELNYNNPNISRNKLNEKVVIYPNFEEKIKNFNDSKENVNEESDRSHSNSSINIFNVITNTLCNSKNSEIDKIEYLRNMILSENILFRNFFNSIKKRKTIYDKEELNMLNNTPIYENEVYELI